MVLPMDVIRLTFTFFKLLLNPIKSILDEYCLIAKIVTGRYPQPTEDQFPLSPLERTFMTIIVGIRSLSLVHLCSLAAHYGIASCLSELYVLLRFFLLIVILILHSNISPFLTYAAVIYCLIDGFNYRLCLIFVDRYKANWGLRSLNRSILLIAINYSELIVGFAVLYLMSGSIDTTPNLPIQPIQSIQEAIYFSVVTITTLGYGDYKPVAPLGRWLCASETLAGFVLIVLVIGTFLSGITNIRNVPKSYRKEYENRFKV